MTKTAGKTSDGERRRHRAAERSRRDFLSAAEIGPIPPVAVPGRRESCRLNLLRFLTTYFLGSTGLKPFSPDHEKIIARIQRCILGGGRFVNAVYRGFAKTTISENTAIWAACYGHRRFVPIFSANKSAANDIIDSLKTELETNDLLAADFPEVCLPIRALEGKPQRCPSQTHNGERTWIEWTADTITVPTIRVPKGWLPGVTADIPSPASGAIIKSKGLLGASRGMKHKTPDGTQQRPDFVILDDCQTDLSAASPFQTTKRLNILRRAILKLAGHSGGLAVVINGNLIASDDLIDQLLRREENAIWDGVCVSMIRQWADAHETLWLEEYAQRRRNYAKDIPGDQARAHRDATEFYRENREAMDAGCQVSWEHCFDEAAEVSAEQHAYNMLIDDGPDVFASECQNTPQEVRFGDETLTASQIAEKINGRKADTCPAACEKVTAKIDVHDRLLYWKVIGWGEGFAGWVVGYGAWPSQNRNRKYPGRGKEGAIVAGLVDLIDQLCDRVWRRDDGVEMSIDRLLIDAGYLPDLVAQAIRKANRGPVVLPSLGMPVGAKQNAMVQWQRRPGEKLGHYWIIGKAPSLPRLAVVKFDSNFWKTFLAARYGTPLGDPGSLSLPGTDPREHRMLAEHLTSEYPTETEGKGRRLQEWTVKPGGPDNHLLDCGAGCAVAASTLGIRLVDAPRSAARPRRRKRGVRYLD